MLTKHEEESDYAYMFKTLKALALDVCDIIFEPDILLAFVRCGFHLIRKQRQRKEIHKKTLKKTTLTTNLLTTCSVSKRFYL